MATSDRPLLLVQKVRSIACCRGAVALLYPMLAAIGTFRSRLGRPGSSLCGSGSLAIHVRDQTNSQKHSYHKRARYEDANHVYAFRSSHVHLGKIPVNINRLTISNQPVLPILLFALTVIAAAGLCRIYPLYREPRPDPLP